ncbi:MAG: undecaprenyl-phosphate glucose phosphotransferase [Bacteroidota bacterium]
MILNKDSNFEVFRFLNDVFLIFVSFYVAFVMFTGQVYTKITFIDFWMLLLLVGAWYFCSRSNNFYGNLKRKSLFKNVLNTFHNLFVQLCIVIIFFFAIYRTSHFQQFIYVYIGLLCILIPLEKILYKRLITYLHYKGFTQKKILIIGAGKTGMAFFDIINDQRHLGYEVVGFLDDQAKPHLNGSYLGKLEKLDEYVSTNMREFDEVVVALPNAANEKIKHIADIVGNHAVKLRIIPAYHELINSQYRVGTFGDFPMITLRDEPLDDIHNRVIKRVFDTVFALFILVFICSWLFPIVAVAIMIDSKGPIFFLQERWGRKNKKIKCYKFRSMYTYSKDVSDKDGKYQQAKKNDSRITRVGRVLRKTNLDEFPQFINVLFGNMSVIGPRPHPTPLNVESKQVVDNYLVRHLVKPGISGWAQVKGFRGDTSDPNSMRERVKCDIWYIENWSLWLDIRIILLTVWGTVMGDKNAF